MAASAGRSIRKPAISISRRRRHASARPAPSPCITCVRCTARRPISPARIAGFSCFSTAPPMPGRCSASRMGSKSSTNCCWSASRRLPRGLPRSRSACRCRPRNTRARSTKISAPPAGGSLKPPKGGRELQSPRNSRMARLSVNLNKVALLRNSRRTGVPDVLRFGRIAHDAGADGLTAHPRPDERHIRRADVIGLAELMRPWRPGFEFNIEGFPDHRYLDLVAALVPEQATLVPDAPDVLTSEEGWKLSADDRRLLDPVIPALKRMGCRVILFVDPDAAVVERARETGADGIEIYTGSYAAAFRAGDP